jgi:CRP/FNR family transcriptional regulator, cyclic AMP receptor protein
VTTSILDLLGPDERRELVQHARRRSFKAKEVVFHEGDPGDTVHLIESGLVAVRGMSPLGDVTTFAVLGPGDTFGELALILPDHERTATVVAVIATRTLSLHRREIEALRRRVSAVDQFLTLAMAMAVQRLSEQLVEMQYLSVDKRLARRIIHLASSFGGAAAGTEIPFTQDDIAGLVGTTRQTANKVLREYQDAGLITLSRGKFTIVDAEALTRRGR